MKVVWEAVKSLEVSSSNLPDGWLPHSEWEVTRYNLRSAYPTESGGMRNPVPHKHTHAQTNPGGQTFSPQAD